MHGDYSRNTFDAKKHYTAVRMQQGRVQLDSDWNEQIDIQLDAHRSSLRDLVGDAATPLASNGFAIRIATSEASADSPPAADSEEGATTSTAPGSAPTFLIGPGRFFVDGVMCQNDTEVSYEEQPHGMLQDEESNEPGERWLVYLDAWTRQLTSVEDPSLREPALGSLDTTTRDQTVWQVRRVRLSGQAAAAELDASAAALPPESLELMAPNSQPMQMEAGMVMVDGQDSQQGDAVEVHGFGVENHYYRVELHEARAEGQGVSRVKWSRDNGSVVFGVNEMKPLRKGVEFHVHGLERDRSQLRVGDWVELIDDRCSAQRTTGGLAQVKEVDASRGTVFIQDDVGVVGPELHPFLRRWDGVLGASGPATPRGEWLVLEDGIRVRFGRDGVGKAGDSWGFVTRDQMGIMSWPVGQLADPDNLQHRRAMLAVLAWVDGQWTVARDCRRQFLDLGSVERRLAEAAQDRDNLRREIERLEVALRHVGGVEACKSPDNLEVGELVSFDKKDTGTVRRASRGNADAVAGVIVGVPDEGAEEPVYRVLTRGRVSCRVYGRIRPGQRLVPSDRAGCAGAASWLFARGTVIGKSIEGFEPTDDEQEGTIQVIVSLA